MAFGVGIVLCFLIYGRDFFRNWATYDKTKDPVFNIQIEAAPATVPAVVVVPEPELSIR